MARSRCEVCKTVVKDNNNWLLLEYIISDGNMSLFDLPSRHLLPVVTDGVYICRGTPDRAQYIEGQPRHNDGHAYNPHFEGLVRFAYAKLRTMEFLDLMMQVSL